MLKVKPEVEAPKAKKAPVYTDSKPRKNQMQEILSQFIGDGFSTDSPALGCEKSMEKSQETIVDDTMNEKIVDTNEASQETVTEPEKQSNGINPQDLLTLAQQSLML
jgi:hypothetical protein